MARSIVTFGAIPLITDNPSGGIGYTAALDELSTSVAANGFNILIEPGDKGKSFITSKSYNASTLTSGPGSQSVVIKKFSGSIEFSTHGGPATFSIVIFAAENNQIGLPTVDASELTDLVTINIDPARAGDYREVEFDLKELFGEAVLLKRRIAFYFGFRVDSVQASSRVKLKRLDLDISTGATKISDN